MLTPIVRAFPVPAPFAVIDVETTGCEPSEDRVLSIGVVLADADGTPVGSWETLVDPGPDVEIAASHIHGITRETLAQAAAPSFAVVAPLLLQHLNSRILVAHNAPFDSGFVDAELSRVGLSRPSGRAVCTLATARLAFEGSHSLRACCDRYGIRHDRPHEALADALATTALLHRFITDGHISR